jgi:hypothetical protein
MKEFQPVLCQYSGGIRYTAYYTPNGWHVAILGNDKSILGPFPTKDEAKATAWRKALDSVAG